MKKKGFTLIELLAVIVILGLLMAIAIPSVTKYITQSRKKTLTNTISNYMAALTNQVNDMEYTFTAANTVYAVPIECIALERGGTDPFGKWYQANNAYWAYALVQYDDATSSYTYGFTFKDSAGYGLYPTTSEKLSEGGSQIQTGLSLTRPSNGTITNITVKENWNGFTVTNGTSLIVLQATSEGEIGNGQTTCTLSQKGDNYAEVEAEQKKNLSYAAKLGDYVKMIPTSTSFSTDTSYGVSAATFNPSELSLWRVIRKNNDGTIELVSENLSSTGISFDGMLGYANYIGYLNIIAKQYENDDYTIGSRIIGYKNQTEFLNYETLSVHNSTFLSTSKYVCTSSTTDNSKESIGCGDILYLEDIDLVEKAVGNLQAKINGSSRNSYYFIGSRQTTYNPSSVNRLFWLFRIINSSGELARTTANANCTNSCATGSCITGYIRPIIVLKANLSIATGDGNSSTPYEITK